MKHHFYALLILGLIGLPIGFAVAQSLPLQTQLLNNKTMLRTGGKASIGLYDESQIRTIELTFSQSDYWQQLTNNYASRTDLPATMIVDGKTYQNVGVRFKGQTSYQRATGQKKSFNITLDYQIEDQNWLGYKTLNLNNAFEDNAVMREVLYYHLLRNHVSAAQAAFVKLKINGENWGVYLNVQQLDNTFISEWFVNDNGTRWRADAPNGTTGGAPGAPPGGGWGDGTAAINYLGADTTAYQKYYTLKKTTKKYPWNDLVQVASVLNQSTTAELEAKAQTVLDVDKTLWDLAGEIVYADDDSYVYKGKMDYYVYYDKEADRLVPLEYDGNSSLATSRATSWSPTYNESKVNYPLLNKLLAVPSFRQRYLAHVRTMTKDLEPSQVSTQIDKYVSLVQADINADTKKFVTNTGYTTGIADLKQFFTSRYNYLKNHAELNRAAPQVSQAPYESANGAGKAPSAHQTATIKATIVGSTSGVNLYYAPNLDGRFEKVAMYDDGLHQDGAANDLVFGASIPGYGAGTWVRYYIEAIANDSYKTVQYYPEGAEHEVLVYQVATSTSLTPTVVINEIQASNTTTVADEAGQYDDWIELYNVTNQALDLSGYFLTDKTDNLEKWVFPTGTVIPANGYLIVWADENGSQGDLHANFKLSASGETLILSNPALQKVDEVTFGTLAADMSYARNPNGTGNFVIQKPTFKKDNTTPVALENEPIAAFSLEAYPNPAKDMLQIKVVAPNNAPVALQLYNVLGQLVWKGETDTSTQLELNQFPAGLYILKSLNMQRKVMIIK